MARKKIRGAKPEETTTKAAKEAPAKEAPKKAAPKKASSEAVSGKPGRIAQLKEFFDQSKVEIKKVVWPTRKETIATSVAVLILVLVMSIFLGIVDLGLAKAIKAILS